MNKNKYYLVTIIKSVRKLKLHYVDESKPPGMGLLTQVDIPNSIDLDSEISLSVKIVDYTVTIGISSTISIENYEIDSAHRIPSDGIGLHTYKGMHSVRSFSRYLYLWT